MDGTHPTTVPWAVATGGADGAAGTATVKYWPGPTPGGTVTWTVWPLCGADTSVPGPAPAGTMTYADGE